MGRISYVCIMYPSIEQMQAGSMLLIDKPLTWTSFDVIGKLRYHTHVKMGHAGTLDPLATGLLIVCTGKHTKKINEYMGQDKIYEGDITLGSTTATYDLESEPENITAISHLSYEDVKSASLTYIGNIKQMPPMHSAIKKNGKRLYEYARKGKEIQIEPRDVRIDEFEILSFENGIVRFRVKCATGTYIRSLAHDLGQTLGVGGHLSKLVRTGIGDYRLADAYELAPMVVHYKSIDSRH